MWYFFLYRIQTKMCLTSPSQYQHSVFLNLREMEACLHFSFIKTLWKYSVILFSINYNNSTGVQSDMLNHWLGKSLKTHKCALFSLKVELIFNNILGLCSDFDWRPQIHIQNSNLPHVIHFINVPIQFGSKHKHQSQVCLIIDLVQEELNCWEISIFGPLWWRLLCRVLWARLTGNIHTALSANSEHP